jgi:hypothetical protein
MNAAIELFAAAIGRMLLRLIDQSRSPSSVLADGHSQPLTRFSRHGN